MCHTKASVMVIIALSVVMLSATAIQAQATTSTIYGTITYFSRFRLPGAKGTDKRANPTEDTAPNYQGPPAVSEDCSELKTQLFRLEARLKDWPNLARYREANSKVEPPTRNEARVVFVGDSITDWWVRPDSGGFFPGKPYLDRGISGQRTGQMLIRFRADVIALKPQVVVILAGTNDLANVASPLDTIRDNLTSMTELARQSGIRVVLASLLPVHDYGKDKTGKPIIQTGERAPDQIKAANEWIMKYAAANHLTYLDYHSPMVDEKGFLRAELSNDGLHPNARGYAVMSPLAEQAIARALKKKR